MVSVHFARTVPGNDAYSVALRAIGETAPVFFFFAFGMTARFFMEKGGEAKRRALSDLLIVAALHNVFMGGLLVTDFLGFLFLCYALIAAISTWRAISRGAAWLSFGGLTLVYLLSPAQEVVNAAKLLIPGPFALFPWLLFVLAGLGFAQERSPRGRRVHGLHLGLIVLALGLHVLYYASGHYGFRVQRGPVTGSYILLLVGVAGVLLLIARSAVDGLGRESGPRLQDRPVVQAALVLPSRYLLLATVLHYLPVRATTAAMKAFIPPEALAANASLAILAGAALANLGTYALLRVTLWGWARVQGSRLLASFAEHRVALAVATVALSAVPVEIARRALQGRPVPGTATWLSTDAQAMTVYTGGLIIAFLGMLLFTLLRATPTRNPV